jgi:uncharacterized membrane protein
MMRISVIKTLTRPTRGRIALWASLALMWSLFLPQDLAMDPDHQHFSWVGAVFWAVVLVWLLTCLRLTWRNYRTSRNA